MVGSIVTTIGGGTAMIFRSARKRAKRRTRPTYLRDSRFVLPGRGRDHGQARELPCKLDQDRADATYAADNQQHVALAVAFLDAKAIEQKLPGRDRRQRQGGRLAMGQARRFPPHDPLIDQVKLAQIAGRNGPKLGHERRQ